MMVFNTSLNFLATGSPSTSSVDLELVLLFLSIRFEIIDTRMSIHLNRSTKMKRSKSSKNQSTKRPRRSSSEDQLNIDPPTNEQTMSAQTHVFSVIVPENTYSGDTIVIEVDSKEYEMVIPQGCSPGTELRIELPVARQEMIDEPDVVETVDEPNVASNGSDTCTSSFPSFLRTTSGEDSGEIPSGLNYVEWVQKVGKYNAETLPDLTPTERRAKKSTDWTAYRCYDLACARGGSVFDVGADGRAGAAVRPVPIIQVLPPVVHTDTAENKDTSLNCNNCAKSFPRGNYSGQPALFKCWDCQPKIECTSCHAEKIRKPNHRDEGFKCYGCRKAKPTASMAAQVPDTYYDLTTDTRLPVPSFYIDGDGDRIYGDAEDYDDAEERYRYSERKWMNDTAERISRW
jgi:hypothetical protein